ncbi:MAG: hypothetical protein E4H31_00175 [Dehalococcoidia bacterium]|nr:MAG: hypothetical protein E4H31_00175 [Dehalococcoidia bacterium]
MNNNIEEIFAECLDAVLNNEASVGQCLERYPEHTADLEGLLATALSIARSPELDPSPGAKMRVRYALNEKMTEMSQPKAKPFWRVGWANAIVTLVLSLSLGGGGIAYTVAGSMPGQVLYPIKINMEQALVSMTLSDDAKINLYAALNDRRVSEIVYLAGIGDSLTIAEVTSRIQDNFFAAAAIIKGTQADNPMDLLATPPTKETMVGIATLSDKNRATDDSSTLNSVLSAYQITQLSDLSNIPVGASLAVQVAMEQAAAVIRSGYDSLLTPDD